MCIVLFFNMWLFIHLYFSWDIFLVWGFIIIISINNKWWIGNKYIIYTRLRLLCLCVNVEQYICSELLVSHIIMWIKKINWIALECCLVAWLFLRNWIKNFFAPFLFWVYNWMIIREVLLYYQIIVIKIIDWA